MFKEALNVDVQRPEQRHKGIKSIESVTKIKKNSNENSNSDQN